MSFIEAFLANVPGMNNLPKKKVLSSKASIVFQKPDGQELELAEIHSFKHTTVYKTVKEWKPFGSKRTKIIREIHGYNLSFSGTKTDWLLNYFMYANEKMLMGESDTWKPTVDSSFENTELIGNQILFDIISEIRFDDGSLEQYRYTDVSISNYDFDVPPDNAEIPENFAAFSPERKFDITNVLQDNYKTIKLTDMIRSILDEQSLVNKI